MFDKIAATSTVPQIPSLAAGSGMAKATLAVIDDKYSVTLFPNDNVFTFQFNPTTLTLTQAATWEENDKSEQGLIPPSLRFKGIVRDKLQFDLFLDESEYRGGTVGATLSALLPMSGLGSQSGFAPQNGSDVLAIARALGQLMLPVAAMESARDRRRPPLVTFAWGHFSFTGYVSNLSTEFLLFAANGDPRRATLAMEMTGAAYVGDADNKKHGLKTYEAFSKADAATLYDGLASAVLRDQRAATTAGGGKS